MAINMMMYKLTDANAMGCSLATSSFFTTGVVSDELSELVLINEIEQSTVLADCIPGSESKFISNINVPEPYPHFCKGSTFNGINLFIG